LTEREEETISASSNLTFSGSLTSSSLVLFKNPQNFAKCVLYVLACLLKFISSIFGFWTIASILVFNFTGKTMKSNKKAFSQEKFSLKFLAQK
jgi:hypothetical protein